MREVWESFYKEVLFDLRYECSEDLETHVQWLHGAKEHSELKRQKDSLYI